MPDRILRDELWQSERFLDLPTDACRVAFLRMVSEADDFGNLEGGVKRLYRMLSSCTQIKTESATATTLGALIDADLIRAYQVGGRDLVHIPRCRPHRQYIVRKMPESPWDADVKLGKTQRIEARGLAKDEQNQRSIAERSSDVATTSHTRSSDVAQGVGVGVGVGVGEEEPKTKTKTNTKSVPASVPVSYLIDAGFDEQTAAEFIAVKAQRKAPLTERAWRDHLAEAKKAGWTPKAAAEKVMAKTWKGFEAHYVANDIRPGSSAETPKERALRERVFAATGGILGRPTLYSTNDYIDMAPTLAERIE